MRVRVYVVLSEFFFVFLFLCFWWFSCGGTATGTATECGVEWFVGTGMYGVVWCKGVFAS